MGCNAANPEPERPVQAVLQYDQYKEVLAIIGHPLGQTVVPYGCQETQQGQTNKKSLEDRRRKSQWKREQQRKSDETKFIIANNNLLLLKENVNILQKQSFITYRQ